MLHDQSLPFFLWAEACSTVVYVQNRSLHHALGCKTPEEMFTGKVPKIGHFRIFGCLTHMSLLRRGQSWRLLQRGACVGYDETSKAFCIYLPTQRKIVVRSEVRFEEEKAFKRSLDSEIEEQHSTPQATVQSSACQSTGSPIS